MKSNLNLYLIIKNNQDGVEVLLKTKESHLGQNKVFLNTQTKDCNTFILDFGTKTSMLQSLKALVKNSAVYKEIFGADKPLKDIIKLLESNKDSDIIYNQFIENTEWILNNDNIHSFINELFTPVIEDEIDIEKLSKNELNFYLEDFPKIERNASFVLDHSAFKKYIFECAAFADIDCIECLLKEYGEETFNKLRVKFKNKRIQEKIKKLKQELEVNRENLEAITKHISELNGTITNLYLKAAQLKKK